MSRIAARFRTFAVVALLTGGGAGLFAADPAEPLGPLPPVRPTSRPAEIAVEMNKAFADLAHAEPASREAARLRLMSFPRESLPAFEKMVKEAVPLAPSQAAALREIVTQVYLSGEPYVATGSDGFLGVRLGEVNMLTKADAPGQLKLNEPNPFDPQPGIDYSTTGVVITERMAGFCGALMLQDGDVVLGLVERPAVLIRNPVEMRQAVMGFGAGKTLHFQLLRQGQVMRVPITLDPRPDDADQIGGPDPMKELLERRRLKADVYWESTFAPLLKEGVG